MKWQELDAGVKNAGLCPKKFNQLFGVQTVCDCGPYPWDVEAVLERMMTGRRTGTQLCWD